MGTVFVGGRGAGPGVGLLIGSHRLWRGVAFVVGWRPTSALLGLGGVRCYLFDSIPGPAGANPGGACVFRGTVVPFTAFWAVRASRRGRILAVCRWDPGVKLLGLGGCLARNRSVFWESMATPAAPLFLGEYDRGDRLFGGWRRAWGCFRTLLPHPAGHQGTNGVVHHPGHLLTPPF